MARVAVIPIMLIICFSQHEALFPTSLASGQPDAVDVLGLHNVLWITKHESGVILFWNNNLTKEETENYTVKYILSYKFFNNTHERKERLKEKKKRIHLEFHSGFNAKVKTQLFSKETEDVIKESGWAEFIYKAPPVYIQNLSCIIYNISFFNCSWNIKAEAPKDIQIIFSYRHAGKDFECQQYIKNTREKNTGCHMKGIHFQPSRKINLNITIRDLRNNSKRLSYYKGFTPQTIEKLNPPLNVSFSLENRSIKIHWKPPPTIGSASKKCFFYQVKITDRKIVNVTAEKYEYPFHQPTKKCVAQVRVKKEVCIRNKVWSEWSEPVLIYDDCNICMLTREACAFCDETNASTCSNLLKHQDQQHLETTEKTPDVMLLCLTLCCLLILLGSLLICVCRRYGCLEVITMPVPGPSDNIKAWLAADETCYQKQMSMQMEMHSEVIMGIQEENGDENIQQRCLKESGLEDL